jgi:hypothetical protein
MEVNEKKESGVLDVCTRFPHRQRSFAQTAQVVLADRCLPENQWQLSSNPSLFPNKIPKNFLGCPLRVSTAHMDPYVILRKNYTRPGGKRIYAYGGLETEYVYLLRKAINMTVEFLSPVEGSFKDTHQTQLMEVLEGVLMLLLVRLP